MDHLYVIFLLKSPFIEIFQLAMFEPDGIGEIETGQKLKSSFITIT